MPREKRWELLTIPLVIGVIVGLWYLIAAVFSLPAYILPTPHEVVESFARLVSGGSVWSNLVVTLREAGFGFSIGLMIALVLGIPVALVPLVRKTLLPLVHGWQSFPHLPLAPLIVVWFGFGETSKIVMAAIMCFFPMFVSIVDGLSNSKSREIEMIRVFGGSSWDVFLRVRIRNALPYFFTGLTLSVIYSLLGAVVAEWIGAQAGVGHLLMSFNYNFQVAEMFAILILLALVGITATSLIRFLRHRTIFWES